MLDAIETRFARLDALVNNAGKAPDVRADLLEATEASFEDLIRTNLQGPYFLTQQVARMMLGRHRTRVAAPAKTRWHRVCDVGVGGARLAQSRRVLRQQGRPRDGGTTIRRAAGAGGYSRLRGAPGIIATDMTAKVKDLYDQRIADGLVPEGRWGLPEDVGKTVAALLRGDLPYATGSVIHVAGGLQIGRL